MRLPALFLAAAAVLSAQTIMPITGPPPPAVRDVRPATPPEDLSKVSGTVVNAVTGEPVRRATVILTRVDATPGVEGMPPSFRSASDDSGAFAMKDIEPGRYRLAATRNGFVSGNYGARAAGRVGTIVSLARRQEMTGMTVKLTPHGVIVGRILDADGEPVPNVRLMLQTSRYMNGRKQLVPSGGSGSTNDLGEYRIFGVAPGKYILSATAPNMDGMGVVTFAVDRSVAPIAEEGYVPTYFPGTTDPATAAPLEVAPGATLRGIDLTLSKAHTVRVKGHVAHGASGRHNISVVIVPRDSGMGFVGGMRNNMVDASGNFEIRGVTPGAYTVIAMLNEPGGQQQGRALVDVGNTNIDNVSIVIGPGLNVKGVIRPDGESTNLDLSTVRVVLQQREPGMMFGGATSARDEHGGFEIKNAAPDRYNLTVFNLPAGSYVKSIRSDQADILTNGLDLTSGAAPSSVDVVVSPRAATVTGSVQNDKGDPAPGAMVVLLPQEKERRDQQSYIKAVTADQHGGFSIASIPPGNYKLYAFDEVEPGAWMDPDFLRPIESKGESVTVGEGDNKSVPLKSIPADAAAGR